MHHSTEATWLRASPNPEQNRIRFAVSADIERLLSDFPQVRTALVNQGVPAAAFRVVADTELAILHHDGHLYIRFATHVNGDPAAVELPSGRVVEVVTRRHPPPETVVSIALCSTSLPRFCEVREAFHAREPFYSRENFESLADSGQIDQLRTDLLAELDRIDPAASMGLWADLAWDIDMGDYPGWLQEPVASKPAAGFVG